MTAFITFEMLYKLISKDWVAAFLGNGLHSSMFEKSGERKNREIEEFDEDKS